ncbi:MAG TPA: ACT domain-containing protein [Burkholderiaceae bacterium]|jgi:glycine cleavage system regulatory protein|nr:ACT domain-containing protein [Burkholderiaceae bacterium]
MTSAVVFTFVGADQPGLVEKLAQTVAQQGGNWLESRMSELAGQFAGIVQVEVSDAQFPALRAALLALSSDDLSVVVASSRREAGAEDYRHLRLSIVGNDRPGIVREVASALAARRINVREMDTSVTSAPMSGDPLFEAVAHIQVPKALDLAELNAQLDAIADALTVEIDLEESLR